MTADGRPVTSVTTEFETEFEALGRFPEFEPMRAVLSQPIISLMPIAMGPFFALSNFDKDWSRAELRSTRARMHVDQAYVPGLPTGSYPRGGPSKGIKDDPAGSFVYRAPWRLSLPYPPRPRWL
jgi:hypothetical protein